MSFRVLVIPEDPTWNGYILKPLSERLLHECGRRRAIVTVLTDPHVQGVEQAVRLLQDDKFYERYKHFDIWLFLPDGDCVSETRASSLTASVRAKGIRFFCCPAVLEVEVWLLAGHSSKLSMSWAEIRAERSCKERFFKPFLDSFGDNRAVGQGRKELMLDTLKNFQGLLTKCPELSALKEDIKKSLQSDLDFDNRS